MPRCSCWSRPRTLRGAGRGARGAEIAGVGIASDPSHLVRSDPEGRGAQLAMRRALQDARVVAEQVVHVNAHATGTPAADVGGRAPLVVSNSFGFGGHCANVLVGSA